MEPVTQAAIAQIQENLQAVGERLSAIDYEVGNSTDHWKAIGALSVAVRAAALALPPDLLARCPQLTDFAQSTRGLEGCWGSCLDEIQQLR